MPKTPVKQVTITMTIQTRARDKTIERQIKMGLRREVSGSYEIQQVLVEDVPDMSSRRTRLRQLDARADHLLDDIELLVCGGLAELEECYEAIEEFEEHTEQPEEYDDDTYT